MALRAKLYFLRHIIFEISLREISKMMCLKRAYSAAAGGKRTFYTTLKRAYSAAAGGKRLFIPPWHFMRGRLSKNVFGARRQKAARGVAQVALKSINLFQKVARVSVIFAQQKARA
jgi:hypothetical protein